MEIATSALSSPQIYKLMTGSIVPRPIGWISTRSVAGSANLAPYSYFNAVSAKPPVIMFSSGLSQTKEHKDTLKNILETKEFVVNIVTEATAQAMNMTAIDAPHGISEFSLAKLNEAPAKMVKAPRVLESPIHFECKLMDVYPVGDNQVVFGKILHLHIADEVLLENYKIDIAKLKPVGRLAGSSYARVNDLFDLARPTYNELKDTDKA